MDDPAAFRGMQVIGFAMPSSDLRRELVELVLAGTKTATAGLMVEMELDGDTLIVCQRFRLIERYAEPIGPDGPEAG